MTEQELLSSLSESYGGVSVPIDCAVEFAGIDKKIVNYAKIDETQNPHTLESCLTTYYVKNPGTETEEIYVSPSISNPSAVADVKTAYDAAVVKGFIIE